MSKSHSIAIICGYIKVRVSYTLTNIVQKDTLSCHMAVIAPAYQCFHRMTRRLCVVSQQFCFFMLLCVHFQIQLLKSLYFSV